MRNLPRLELGLGGYTVKEETGERRNARRGGERLKLEKRKMDMAILSLFPEMGEERKV